MPYCALCEATVTSCPHLSVATHALPAAGAPPLVELAVRPPLPDWRSPDLGSDVEAIREPMKEPALVRPATFLDEDPGPPYPRPTPYRGSLFYEEALDELRDDAQARARETGSLTDEVDLLSELGIIDDEEVERIMGDGPDVVRKARRSRLARLLKTIRGRPLRQLPPAPPPGRRSSLMFSADVAAEATVNISVMPQLACRPKRLIFAPAEGLMFCGARVGKYSQELLPGGEASTTCFPPYPEDGPYDNIDWSTVLVGMYLMLTVRNMRPVAQHVSAVVVAETMPIWMP